ncbi:MAG: hypothetical protein QM490_05550 [Candidatus Gracilibacteria bacterium]
MNYQSLKGMIESLIKSYRCPECTSGVTDVNIDIIGAAGSTINIDIECSKCGKHSMVKTEVLSIDLNNKNISLENIQKLKNSLALKDGKILNTQKIINDTEIVDLNKNLRKNKLNVSDLLGDNK